MSIVADANVLLSAIVGNAALRVFTESSVRVHATRFNADEVEQYLPRLSSRYNLPEHLVGMLWRLLPVTLHDEASYAEQLPAARHALAERDTDDAHPLALARKLELPLWSNDRHLMELDVTCYSTAQLLKELGL
jgi:predicted nucleic acid-binding protein